MAQGLIRTPDQRIRVFVSSTLAELANERVAVREAIEQLRLTPVMFESGARAHPPRELYRSYLSQSQVFVGLYWERYGWVAPGESISGLEDEFLLSEGMPRLLYLKRPAPAREPRLDELLARLQDEGSASYRSFTTPDELRELVLDDLVVLLSERFEGVASDVGDAVPTATVGASTLRAPPVPMTRMVGREEDVEHVARRLRDGARLVTLTGPGGIGKTRLALECARQLHGAPFDEVVFVPLEAVSEPSQLLRAVRERLAIVATGTRPTLEVLVEALGERRVLLVLDNFEQLVDAAPQLADLLSRCHGVHALVTSRQVLRLRGEVERPVGPLDPTTALGLFVDRAAAARPGFQLVDDDRATVLALCRRLDGLPLAIELAAARIRLLPPKALLERLEGRLDLLTGGAADLPHRQRTLRATLDWSHDLLAPAERALLARLSVFAGGAALDAVEAVCADDEVTDVLETLSSLVEKSLVVSTQDDAGNPRVRLLQTVADYARERLVERGELAAMRLRHTDWFVRFVERADTGHHEDGARHWSAMEVDRDNLRAAAGHMARTRDLDRAAVFARSVCVWSWQSGRLREFQEWIERLLPRIGEDVAPATAGTLLYFAAQTRLLLGGLDAAAELIGRAVDLVVEAGESALVSGALMIRSITRLSSGRVDEARDDAQLAVEIAQELNNSWILGFACMVRGQCCLLTGDLAGARADLTTALVTAERLSFDVLTAQSHTNLAWICMAEAETQGRPKLDEARSHLTGQLVALERSRNLEGLGYALDVSAGLALLDDRPEDAARALGTARSIRTQPGISASPIYASVHEAHVASVRDQLGATAARRLMDDTGELDPWAVAPVLLASEPVDITEVSTSQTAGARHSAMDASKPQVQSSSRTGPHGAA